MKNPDFEELFILHISGVPQPVGWFQQKQKFLSGFLRVKRRWFGEKLQLVDDEPSLLNRDQVQFWEKYFNKIDPGFTIRRFSIERNQETGSII